MESILHILGFCTDNTTHTNIISLILTNNDVYWMVNYLKNYLRA